MGTLYVDESGNVFHPSGSEVLSVACVYADGNGNHLLRRHVEQARRRASRPVGELRYRSADPRTSRFFFDDARLAALPIRVFAVVTRIEDMAVFRTKHHPSNLYEHLLYGLVQASVRRLGAIPERIHFDPSSAFTSQRGFAHRIEGAFTGCTVVFSPDSLNEKGLQAADMIAGSARRHALGGSPEHWDALVRCCGAVCLTIIEAEIRMALWQERNQGRGTTSPRSSSGS